jgi:cardiolipin synthase
MPLTQEKYLMKHIVLKQAALTLSLSILMVSVQAFVLDEKLIIEPNAGKRPFYQLIKSAKNNIKLILYGFTDRSLAKALVSAHKKKINVKVILEHAPYKYPSENKAIYKFLKRNGVNIKWSNPAFRLTHQKTLIIDKSTATIMTLNFTHSAFKKQRNFAITINTPKAVKDIVTQFEYDWNHVKSSVKKNPNLLWSPGNAEKIFIAIAKTSNKSINIIAPDLNLVGLINTLGRKADNKVTVKIITSKQSFKKNRKKFCTLQQHHVNIRVAKKLFPHAKLLLAKSFTHTYYILGSTNFTWSSVNNNRELSILGDNLNTSNRLEEIYKKDWQAAKPWSGCKNMPRKTIDSEEKELYLT